ncbi:DNA excision repair protein ERCC-1 [Solea senegalensis]|uniref:DNA excision repair protein ERCC-1 n=1 Tax=Solea senegalensis TaxID=28829 RepID=A0AAV6R7W7_SOLSE|nr:DNA excision repair protein ERCC-1 [Solea senegalensis]KAG7501551.1 DNA excision repair protein ERCC-1 [Solea senegalensis]
MSKRFNINLDDTAFMKERTPPKPQFLSSSKGQVASASSVSSAESATVSVDQPLSYAQYIVQSKHGVAAAAPQREPPPPKLPRSDDTDVTSLKESGSISSATDGFEAVQDCTKRTECGSKGVQTTEETQVVGTDQTEVKCQKSDAGLSLGPKPVGSGSSIIVSTRQRGNPILKFVRSVPWEFGDVVPDYVLGQTTCALFLSLRYHNLNPNYIHDRLKQLGQTFMLRVLLVQVDVKDPHHALKELARICIMADCTLILAWSPEEAGRYLETYKSYEKKPADVLKEQVEKNYLSKVTDCLTTVKSVNKTDAITLLSTFSSIEGIISASKEDLVLCPGLGPQKARRLHDVLHKPFLKSKTKDS